MNGRYFWGLSACPKCSVNTMADIVLIGLAVPTYK
jgi:hypothetical protein